MSMGVEYSVDPSSTSGTRFFFYLSPLNIDYKDKLSIGAEQLIKQEETDIDTKILEEKKICKTTTIL